MSQSSHVFGGVRLVFMWRVIVMLLVPGFRPLESGTST